MIIKDGQFFSPVMPMSYFWQREQEKLEAKQRRKEARAKGLEEKRKQLNGGAQSLADLAQKAEAKNASFQQNESFVSSGLDKYGSSKAVEGSLKAYYKEFRKVG